MAQIDKRCISIPLLKCVGLDQDCALAPTASSMENLDISSGLYENGPRGIWHLSKGRGRPILWETLRC